MKKTMARATGVRGIFLRATDPDKLHAFFALNTAYFGPTEQKAMLNQRVDDLDAVLAKLRAANLDIDPKREDHAYGRFTWFNDPEGNRGELWQPPSPANG
jgi:hypothetical protein